MVLQKNNRIFVQHYQVLTASYGSGGIEVVYFFIYILRMTYSSLLIFVARYWAIS